MIEILISLFIVFQVTLNVINRRQIIRLGKALKSTNGILNETRQGVVDNRKAIREVGKFLDKRGLK